MIEINFSLSQGSTWVLDTDFGYHKYRFMKGPSRSRKLNKDK